MKFLPNLRLAVKLPLAMSLMLLVCLGLAVVTSYVVSDNQIRKEVDQRLIATADGRAALIEAWADSVRRDLKAYAHAPETLQAMRNFDAAFRNAGEDHKAYLQTFYIDDNPHPTGEKHRLDKAEDGSFYSRTHEKYHPIFRNILEERGFYDIFLISPDGEIVYTVFKEMDFATNLLMGEYRTSNLGAALRKATEAPEIEIAFSDFAPYAPSHGAPAAFVARPIQDELGDIIGYLAFQLPTDRMQAIMSSRDGLSETVEVAVLADDGTSRSDTVLGGTLPVLSEVAPNAAIQSGLAGETGVAEVGLEDGRGYETAYRPIDFLGRDWVLLAAEPVDVINAASRELLVDLSLAMAALLVLVSVISLGFANRLLRPLGRITRAMEAIKAGDYATEVPEQARRDEVGAIASATADLLDDLRRFHAGAQENTYKSAAFTGSSAAAMITDQDFNIRYANPSVMRLISQYETLFQDHVPGFRADEVLGANMDRFHKDKSVARRILGNPQNLPYRADICLGDRRFDLEVSAVRDPSGGLIGYVVEWKDVSQERLNASVLTALEENQCLVQVNGDGTVERLNPQMQSICGPAATTLPGLRIDDLFLFEPEHASENGTVWDRLRDGLSVYGTFRVRAGAGREAWIDGGFTPVLDKRRNLVKVVFIGVDRTAAETALREAEERRRRMQDAQNLVVDQLRIALERMSGGDLTATIDVAFSGEYEQLREDFNRSVHGLRGAMQGVADASQSISEDVAGISDAAADLSRRTEKQAATLEETAAALDQLTASVEQAANGAAEADRIVSEARQRARASGVIVGETVSAMDKIEQSSQQISKIISVIDDIAFQTNLLALNAGVEAARAGDAGRGFAVVASEVRALAQRSSDAASEINALITESTAHVQHGVRLVDRTGAALEQIVASVGDISEHVSQISRSAQEQSTGLAEINAAVNQIDQATQQNAAMFEETTAASAALLREANALAENVGNFDLGMGRTSHPVGSPGVRVGLPSIS